MIRRPPRSTQSRSSAASDVYKRQVQAGQEKLRQIAQRNLEAVRDSGVNVPNARELVSTIWTVSYTHLRAHETVLDLVCRLLLEKKKNNINYPLERPNYNDTVSRRI